MPAYCKCITRHMRACVNAQVAPIIHIPPHIYIQARVTTFGYLSKPCCFLSTATRYQISTSAFPLPLPSIGQDKTAHAGDKNTGYSICIYVSMYPGSILHVPRAI